MDLARHVEALRTQLVTIAGVDPAAHHLDGVVDAAVRMAMLELLGEAAGEISAALATGSVELRLSGRDPSFAVGETAPSPGAEPPAPGGLDGPVTRVNFRPPEQLKQRLDEAAAADGVSVNAWLISAVDAALSGRRRHRASNTDKRQRGWVG